MSNKYSITYTKFRIILFNNAGQTHLAYQFWKSKQIIALYYHSTKLIGWNVCCIILSYHSKQSISSQLDYFPFLSTISVMMMKRLREENYTIGSYGNPFLFYMKRWIIFNETFILTRLSFDLIFFFNPWP